MNSRLLLVLWLLAASALCLGTLPGKSAAEEQAEPQFSPEQLEFFERKIRPLLVNRCYECHGPEKQEPDGGLWLHSRETILLGGDSGPAIEPGDPDFSLLIEAVKYESFEMPPRNPLPDEEIALLEQWVKQGAPWPSEEVVGPLQRGEFPLWERKAEHWAWQPVLPQEPPPVQQADWPQQPLDYFVLARLEAAGMTPAPPADRRTLIRRAYLDLIGLPPAPQQIAAFLDDSDPTPVAFAKVVDELLDSPHYGERWARHWLDLVRYAETRGHEFDLTAPNAWQYRDYLIRALNLDVPYDRLVLEHFAGDLLPEPRRHPERGFNESILGTGFWFLNEQVHSPVDIRHDEAERMDNMIDVATKSFLGLTVSCARCHDHKFDAITATDFYALQGYLRSSRYVQTRFDSMDENREIAEQLAEVRDRGQAAVKRAIGESIEPTVGRLADYLSAARQVATASPAERQSPREDRIVADFESGTYEGWTVSGEAFGDKPVTLDTIAEYQGQINAEGRYFVNSHNVRDGADSSVAADDLKGELLSDEFLIDRKFLTLLVGGGNRPGELGVNLLVDGEIVHTAVGRNNNRMFPVVWNLAEYQGRKARLQVLDQATGGWGNIGMDHAVLRDRVEGEGADDVTLAVDRRLVEEVAEQHGLDATLLERWAYTLIAAVADPDNPWHLWAAAALDPRSEQEDHVARHVTAAAERGRRHAERRQAQAEERSERQEDVVIDFTRPLDQPYLQEGVSFHLRPRLPGDIEWGRSPEQPIDRLHVRGGAWRDPAFHGLTEAPGTEHDPGRLNFVRAGRTLHTPTFTIDERPIWIVAQGAGRWHAVVDSHRVIQGPLHGRLVSEFDTGGQVRAIRVHLPTYAGHRAHFEFTPNENTSFAIFQVVQAETGPAVEQPRPQSLVEQALQDQPPTLAGLAAAYQQVLSEVALRFREDRLADGPHTAEYAEWANWAALRLSLLRTSDDRGALEAAARETISAQEALAGRIVRQSRLAIGIMDGSGEDEFLMIRGSHKNLGPPVQRRLLLAIAGEDQPPHEQGSGRLELAERILSEDNPFASRVPVNRIWHHLFGRGIVGSVDNFGVLGEEPTHPELLDHLAARFVEQGWSQKALLREIMLSSTYHMSSFPDPEAEQSDPQNLLLHRMPLRRMQAEAIRDSILSVSGRLDPQVEGPPVEVHLTPFMSGRGRPGASGPLDGDGRRSVYIRVRRNFLSPMMLAFDTPIPFSTMGRRNVSNVPAQALTLMNDPFVVQQAERWARRVLEMGELSVEDRIAAVYEQGLGRPPEEQELAEAKLFLREQAELRGISQENQYRHQAVWADFCHVVFNLKEFIHIP